MILNEWIHRSLVSVSANSRFLIEGYPTDTIRSLVPVSIYKGLKLAYEFRLSDMAWSRLGLGSFQIIHLVAFARRLSMKINFLGWLGSLSAPVKTKVRSFRRKSANKVFTQFRRGSTFYAT